MAGTRSGTKRKADDSSPSSTKSKRGRPSKASEKEQKTLEETMPDADEEAAAKDADMEEEGTNGEGKSFQHISFMLILTLEFSQRQA